MFSFYLLAFKTKLFLVFSGECHETHVQVTFQPNEIVLLVHFLVMKIISDFVMKYDLDVFHGCDCEHHTRVSCHLFHIDVRNELNDTVLSCCSFHLVFDVPVLFLWLFIMDGD